MRKKRKEEENGGGGDDDDDENRTLVNSVGVYVNGGTVRIRKVSYSFVYIFHRFITSSYVQTWIREKEKKGEKNGQPRTRRVHFMSKCL